MINIIYRKKDIIFLTGTRFGKSLLYQLISLIKKRAIVFKVLLTIVLMTNQVYLPIIIFYASYRC